MSTVEAETTDVKENRMDEQETAETIDMNESETATQENKKKSKKWWIIGGVVLVLLLVAGAFMGGMWMVGKATGMSDMVDPEAFQATLVSLDVTPNKEPEMAGVVTDIADNSIYVSTANSTGAFAHSPGATVELSPPVEVVIGRDTAVLADITALNFDFSNIFSGDGDLALNVESEGMEAFAEGTKRIIEQGSLEDIQPNSMIWVWGEHNGDRINADAVLYILLPFDMGQ